MWGKAVTAESGKFGPFDRGEVNEQFFIDFLRAYLPNRYTVEKAIVMDSNGSVSHSIDVVVFDRQYTLFCTRIRF